ncbi:MAG TPA: DUF255 domain-containing protein [Fimbriimonadaceae bacterium]|nr:DUF255 domain-containing protein [Fimbriimonadaceae bacterium]
MPNRLASESSPYLLQHKDNPVDWYPWGEEAFARAQAEDKPVLLSVGYSSCHWCHVMAHESFESEEVARVLNESFVSVKVDREERPDVDEAYMTAVQLSSGRGGWPMTVFLTPDKKPFFAGTYFPREDRGGHPGFLTICRQIALLWRTKRAEIGANAEEFALGLAQTIGRKPPATFAKFDEAFIANAVRALAADFDEVNGGFGGAPKFPPHTAIDFLLRYSRREAAPRELREKALEMALFTLEKMALGGIHDHVGGGFHRYSTDAEWHLPHFEKMLYDNALMLGNLFEAQYPVGTRLLWLLVEQFGIEPQEYGISSGPCSEMRSRLFDAARDDTIRWILREMTAPEGYFYSAQDADSEGEEGKYYTWTIQELRNLLSDRAEGVVDAYGLLKEGNFRDEASGRRSGANVLHMRPPAWGGGSRPAPDLTGELEVMRAARERRPAPMLDDKCVVSWNGLMISAWKGAHAADSVLDRLGPDGFVPHVISEAAGPGFLEDYASLGVGLYSLADWQQRLEEQNRALEPEFQAQPIGKRTSAEYRAAAESLTRRMIELFWDEEEGGFFSTSKEHEELFGRSKPVFDSPTPSGNALALRCLIEIGDYDRAWKLVNSLLGWMERAPTATEALYAAAMELLDRTDRRVVPKREDRTDLTEVVAALEPGAVVIQIPPGLHINGHRPPAKWLVPTELRFDGIEAAIDYPDGDEYRGEVRIPFRIRLPEGVARCEFEVRVNFQACTDTECQLPAEIVLTGDAEAESPGA